MKGELNPSRVLILVLMEDTLGDTFNSITEILKTSLNPCFNGRYSRRKL